MTDVYRDQPATPASGQEANATPVPDEERREGERQPQDEASPEQGEERREVEGEPQGGAPPVREEEVARVAEDGVADASSPAVEVTNGAEASDQGDVVEGEAAAMETEGRRPSGYAATLEHMLARQPQPPLDPESLPVRERLSRLRTDVTTLLTDWRWGGLSKEEVARRLVPLLDFSPLPQWASLVASQLYEIDRAGSLIPVWRVLAESADFQDLERQTPQGMNPAETPSGKARRLAVLVLGNYKDADLTILLGRLAFDPHLSLYAAQALLRQNTLLARQTLMRALKEAEGWARVDLLEAGLKLKQPSFFDVLLAAGLEGIPGLEAYVAPSLYRTLPIETYLDPPPQATKSLKLIQHAALVCYYVCLESMRSASLQPEQPPILFERELRPLLQALFTSARRYASWQQVVALHQLALLLGRYWRGIAHGLIREPQVIQRVMDCLPLMPDVERWMNGPARDILLTALQGQDERAWSPVLRTLLDLRELRLCTPLLAALEKVGRLESVEEAQRLALACEALATLGDGRALGALRRLLTEVVALQKRVTLPQRAEPLPPEDEHVPGSILAVAVLRSLAQFGARESLDLVVQASHDFDPVVREAALEALMRLDARGEQWASRMAMREALSDQSPAVARLACRLAAQFQDRESLPALRYLLQSRPAVREAAAAALAQLEQAVA
ncbi:HEAT repeat domain-containing protein [Thermogemmatispora sp.]|uniref:HEAT repeat domain-containing protein n=1 Tax=Thermogemmatispora sp. TaxID=1968838 RepID=UPI0035E40791